MLLPPVLEPDQAKSFAQSLCFVRVPAELLHPKPSEADDDDAFVFVDTSTLAKISCFSGDWVRIEVSKMRQ